MMEGVVFVPEMARRPPLCRFRSRFFHFSGGKRFQTRLQAVFVHKDLPGTGHLRLS